MTTTPELDERRIEAMRSSIMHTVDADVTRRGRRVRRGLGALAAACLVVVIGGVGFSNLPNQNAGSDSAARSTAPQTADEGGRESVLADSKAAPEYGREIVTTGRVDVTVKSPRDVAERFSTWVEAHQGRVDRRTVSKNGEGRASASMTVRVPSAQVSATLARLATYGEVGTVDVQHDDVTAQGQDLDARIRALKLSIDRLEKILARADSSAEVVSAENALTDRQEQLESLLAQRKALSDQVALSTLSVELIQKGSASSVSPGGFQGGLTKGWNALVDTVNGIVSVAGVLVPWLGIAFLGWIAWWAIRRARAITRQQ